MNPGLSLEVPFIGKGPVFLCLFPRKPPDPIKKALTFLHEGDILPFS